MTLNDDFDDSLPSKSQVKREVLALTDLGARLVAMSPNQMSGLPIDDDVMEAILLARKIRNKHVGYRRQIQYIGKLLRNTDIQPLLDALAEREQAHLQDQANFHALEQWRDRLIAEGDDAVQEVLERYPDADRQKLRQLIRQARKQAEQNKPPAAAREIFRHLREASGH
ncbi:MAG: DUF615 domain-containing protein [Idiomarina sp.]|nr:DUF615 domain-containing protein [Idiomarina sp.]